MRKRVIAMLISLLLAFTWALAVFAPVWPRASGDKVISDSKLIVDASHVDEGYFMAAAKKSDKRYKLRVESGGETFTYDINGEGEYEVFPLQKGSGSYKISLYVNAGGKKYAAAGTVSIKAKMENEYAAFLTPNQYVLYNEETEAVALSNQLCDGLETDREKYEAIHDYLCKNLVYDFVKAYTVEPGSMPDIDGCLTKKMGICQDIAATLACMLRVQGIPTKLMIGYFGKQYHAWNVVVLDGTEMLVDVTAEIGGASGASYSVERYY